MTGKTPDGGRVAAFTGESGRFLFVLSFGWFLTLGARFLVPALLPFVKAEFGLENTGAGLVVTVVWLTYGVMQFPAGVLVDRVGERTLLSTSAGLAAISMLGFAVAPSYPLFLLAGAGFGLATGLYGPARGIALTRRFDAVEGVAFGTVLGAGSVGAAVLPFAVALSAGVVDWRVSVGAIGPAFFLAALGLARVVPENLGDGAPTPSLSRGVSRTARALTRRRVGTAVAAIVLMLFVFQGLTAFYPTYLVVEGRLSQSTASALYAVLFLAGGAFQLGAGRFADRFGYRRVLVATGAVSVVPLLVLPRVHGLGWFGIVTVLIALRLAIAPMTNAYIVGSLSEESRGTSWGLIRTGFFVLGAFGSVVVGGLADLGRFDVAIYGLAGVTVLGTLLYASLPRENRGDGRTDREG
ncbi:MAG: MFS transporter [Halanaeroarchaeum sp.]